MKEIRLEAKRAHPTVRQTIKGVNFRIALSPYFFPDRLECAYKPSNGCLDIRFKYIDDEPATRVADPSDLFDLEVGRFTSRINVLRIKVDKHDLDSVKLQLLERVSAALDFASEREPDLAENYSAAKSAIESHKQEVAQLVVAG